ncbi:hypothetical protein TYRP_022705, partial [Tyrophagus putrescentiae]
MISAINGLSTLKCLAMKWGGKTQWPVELSILSRLETVIFETFSLSNRLVLPSLIRHAAGNDNLKVIISPGKNNEWLTFLNNPLSHRLVRFLLQYSGLFLKDNLYMLCEQLSFLTSINVEIDKEEQFEPVFIALAQLPHLVHLKLDISPPIRAMLFSLPYLVWEKIFEKLPVQDQLNIAKVCTRGEENVRNFNRFVTTMVISNWATPEKIENAIHRLSLASAPSMQLALSAGGDQFEPFADYPLTTAPPSQWAYLELLPGQLLDSDTIESIVNTFPAIIDLKFFGYGDASCKNLTALLQHPQWRHQLTNLMMYWPKYSYFSDDRTTTGQLISAVNDLSKLKFLAMRWFATKHLPVELSILSQLKVVSFDTAVSQMKRVVVSHTAKINTGILRCT